MARLKIVNSLTINNPCHNKNFKENSTETTTGWFCHECNKDVHDLSRYTKQEIDKLYQEKQGSFCAVIKRKADGSIITKEPISRTGSLIAAGVLFAATSAMADPSIPANIEAGGIGPYIEQPKHKEVIERGDVAIPTDIETGEISVENPTTPTPSPTLYPSDSNKPMTDSERSKYYQQFQNVEVGKIAVPQVNTAPKKIKK